MRLSVRVPYPALILIPLALLILFGRLILRLSFPTFCKNLLPPSLSFPVSLFLVSPYLERGRQVSMLVLSLLEVAPIASNIVWQDVCGWLRRVIL